MLEEVDADQCLAALQNEHLALSDVIPSNHQYYCEGLKRRLRERREQVSEGGGGEGG